MTLQRIVFYSTNNTPFTDELINDLAEGILESCVRHDPNGDLTGALLFNERYFVQVMEGDRIALAAKMWALAADKRHSTMVMLSADDIERRTFARWSVGFAGRSVASERLCLRFGASRTLDPTTMTGRAVLDLLTEFAQADQGPFVKHAEKAVAACAA